MFKQKMYNLIVVDKNNVRWAFERLIKGKFLFVKENEAVPQEMNFSEARKLFDQYPMEKNEIVIVKEL